ncbi:MAG: glycosyltransferase [Verrucomicrobiota bacterium]
MNILWLKTGPLHPLDSGGKIRTYHMLRELMKNHRVTYRALCPGFVDESVKKGALEYSHDQQWIPWKETSKQSPRFFLELGGNLLASRLPYVIQKYRSAGMSDLLLKEAPGSDFDIVICDFLSPAINIINLRASFKAKTLLFQHNVESLIWQRMRDTAAGPLQRAYLADQWRRMFRFERKAAAWFDGVVGVSDEDCRMMREMLGLTNVMGSVPTGVDSGYFQEAGVEKKSGSIVFLGSMDWMPNIDAVSFFMEAIYPELKKRVPDVSFTIVGRNPPERVRDLAKSDPSVCVTGTVDDVRPFVAGAEVVVVPLRVGGGTRIKIFEAMAAGVPVVSTCIGAEGLPVQNGGNILLADEPVEFAACVARLLQEPELRTQIGGAGMEFVRTKFGWESATKVFEGYCRQLVDGRP